MQDPMAQYTIYTFSRTTAGKSQWHKHTTLDDLSLALESAERLFDSGSFTKVEIKQKYYDAKKGCYIDTVLRVFENKTNQHGATCIMAFAALCGLLAFAIIYHLGH